MNWVKCEAKAIGKTVNWHCLVWVLLLGLGQSEADAGDWPQILGPNRNGVAEGEKLLASWPAAGPKLVWERAVGSGFAGVAVADGKAVLFHRVGNEEVVEAMQADTGRVLWKQTFATDYTSQISSDSGPRCVPVLHDGMAYLFMP